MHLLSLWLATDDTVCLLLSKAERQTPDVVSAPVNGPDWSYTFLPVSVKAGQALSPKQKPASTPWMWIFEETLFGNSLREAGIVAGPLAEDPVPHLPEQLTIRSSRLLLQLVEEVCAFLPESLSFNCLGSFCI